MRRWLIIVAIMALAGCASGPRSYVRPLENGGQARVAIEAGTPHRRQAQGWIDHAWSLYCAANSALKCDQGGTWDIKVGYDPDRTCWVMIDGFKDDPGAPHGAVASDHGVFRCPRPDTLPERTFQMDIHTPEGVALLESIFTRTGPEFPERVISDEPLAVEAFTPDRKPVRGTAK